MKRIRCGAVSLSVVTALLAVLAGEVVTGGTAGVAQAARCRPVRRVVAAACAVAKQEPTLAPPRVEISNLPRKTHRQVIEIRVEAEQASAVEFRDVP